MGGKPSKLNLKPFHNLRYNVLHFGAKTMGMKQALPLTVKQIGDIKASDFFESSFIELSNKIEFEIKDHEKRIISTIRTQLEKQDESFEDFEMNYKKILSSYQEILTREALSFELDSLIFSNNEKLDSSECFQVETLKIAKRSKLN